MARHSLARLGLFTLAAGALLVPEAVYGTCQRCDPNRPRCMDANYSKCVVEHFPDLGTSTCEESWSPCGWAYNAAEVSADGSLAAARLPGEDDPGLELARGCHQLVVARHYSADRAEHLRAESASLRI